MKKCMLMSFEIFFLQEKYSLLTLNYYLEIIKKNTINLIDKVQDLDWNYQYIRARRIDN